MVSMLSKYHQKKLVNLIVSCSLSLLLFLAVTKQSGAQVAQPVTTLTPTPTPNVSITPTPYLQVFTESNTARTIIGSPPSAGGPRQQVLIWADKITSKLKKGVWEYYNRLDERIGNGVYATIPRQGYYYSEQNFDLYWCTFLVIDAYNLAGVTQSLTISSYALVYNLANRMKTLPGLNFLDYASDKSILNSVQPGDILFHINPGSDRKSDHASIIKDIVINGAGDGKIVTLNSNAGVIEITYTVTGWTIQPMGTMPPIVGFGSIEETSSAPEGRGPILSVPSPGAPSGTATSLIKAGSDIKTAYDSCAGGYTTNVNNIGACLKTQLTALGYSQSLVNAFETRRSGTITNRNCTECLGYVALALTLVSGSTNTLYQAQASDVLGSSTISAGGITLTKQPPGTTPLPGDIAVAGGGAGHIAIVNSAAGITFTALESNAGNNCKVTTDRIIVADRYTFYR